ncbi:single-stranded DNA-binding protein [Bacteroidetes/Chlorobi group bacterium MS-B_bin-24]|jgi:single-strand DNA-binding protein|nr:MAG: single-stranded DNA-binding protein [Bacteroidetes/Chlorobi group bacterium MS-B_bin-24]
MAGRSLNKAQLIGNVGKDPELRKTPQGNSVCTLRVATTEFYRGRNGERKEITDWHSVVLWDRLAEIAVQKIRKSDKIYVEGKLRTRSFEKDGVTKFVTEIIAQNIIILSRKQPRTDSTTDTSSEDSFNINYPSDYNPTESSNQ